MAKLSLDAFEKATEEEMVVISGGKLLPQFIPPVCYMPGNSMAIGGGGGINPVRSSDSVTYVNDGNGNFVKTSRGGSDSYYYLTFGFGLTPVMSENEEKRNREELMFDDSSFYNLQVCTHIGSTTYKVLWGTANMTVGTSECLYPSPLAE